MFVLEWIYIAIVVFLLFGAAIFVHEWGHYIVARWCGLKVEAFAIGFGPPIYVWHKNGIEYSIRWIPAGGYVKLPQMLTSDALEGSSDCKEGETPPEPLPPASPLSKILVAFAGPFMNVVFAFGIASFLYVFGLPIKVNPSVIGYVDPESEEYQKGVRVGDRIMKIGGQFAKSWDDVFHMVIVARTNVIDVEFLRGEETFTVPLAADIREGIGLKMLNLGPKDRPMIAQVLEGKAAEKAGIKSGDEVVSFAGIPIVGGDQFVKEVRKRGGIETEIIVQRDGEQVSLKVTPEGDKEIEMARIGVMIGSSGKETYIVQKPGPLPWVLVGDTVNQIKTTIMALVHSKKTGVKASDLSGPVGILSVLAAQVKQDLRLALKFMILLNISLAVMNLLPIPVLDGGHIVMSILERFRGKPLNVRVQEYTTTAFALLLISFMLYVTYADARRFPMFLNMFKQEVVIEDADPKAPSTPQLQQGPVPGQKPEPPTAPIIDPAPAK
jgi:regulator of sigma E protease